MKTIRFFIFTLFFFEVTLHLAPAQIPQKYPSDRYDSLRKHLPFGKSTTPETEAPKPPPFTNDLTLLGFSKVGAGYYVTLINKKTQEKIQISPKEKPDGITVAEVVNNSDINKVEIKLKKGDEIGSVSFDSTFLSQNRQPGGIATMPQVPLTQPNGSGPIQPQNFPRQNQPFAVNPDGSPQPAVPQAGSPDASNPTASQVINPGSTNGAPTVRRLRRVLVPTQSQ